MRRGQVPCCCPLGSLLASWNPFGWLRRSCRLPLDNFLELDFTFQANVSFVPCPRTKCSLLELARCARCARCTRGNGVKTCTTRPHIQTRQGPASLWLSFGVPLWIPFGSSSGVGLYFPSKCVVCNTTACKMKPPGTCSLRPLRPWTRSQELHHQASDPQLLGLRLSAVPFGPSSRIRRSFATKHVICNAPAHKIKLPGTCPLRSLHPRKRCQELQHQTAYPRAGSQASCGCPLGSLLALWNLFGWHRGTHGFPLDHLLELGATFRANVSLVMRMRTKSSLLELACCAHCARGDGVKNCITRSHIHTCRGPGFLWLSFGVPCGSLQSLW